MKPRILVSCPNMLQRIDAYRPRMARAGLEVDAPTVEQHLHESELMEVIDRYDGVIAGDDQFTASVIAAGARSRLRVISKWGVGIDNIDLPAAQRHGVVVTSTPGAFEDEVADVVVGYLVMLARHLHRIDAAVRAGAWFKPVGTSLRGKAVGIVGLGSIGRALIARALAMGMEVVGTDPSQDAEDHARGKGAKIVPFDVVVSQSDFLVLSCPLTEPNRHLMNATTLARMRPGAYLVNTSRGPLIDQAALVKVLSDGHLAGAALDVFEDEPLPSDDPLRSIEAVILGSHNSSNTAEAVDRVSHLAIENLLRELGLEKEA